MKKYLKRLIIESGSRGFTLIELLIVMVIISLLSALVGPSMFKKLKRSRVQAARAQIALLDNALEQYQLDNYQFPQDLQGLINNTEGMSSWDGPYLKKKAIPKDPWQNEYIYRTEGEEYTLFSAGEDGDEGTEDDVTDDSGAEEGSPEEGDVLPPG